MARPRWLPLAAVAALVAVTLIAAPSIARVKQEPFPHEKHARLFPLCVTCHLGVVEPGEPLWPQASQCASCHDGQVAPEVTMTPRTESRASNLRFTHQVHASAATAHHPADSTRVRDCSSCHTEAGTQRMAVRHAVVGQCLDCHGLTDPHVDVPSAACSTCHVRLTDAPRLASDRIARFPRPRSHDEPGFLLGGHGQAARGPGPPSSPEAVAASCATCHARNLCLSCHVDAPEQPTIRALLPDPRVPQYAASQPIPPSHTVPGFLRTHGREAQRSVATCATCHTRESCSTCHVETAPRVVAALPSADTHRAAGALLLRVPPPNHTLAFMEGHGPEASARPATCESCHTRSTCLSCHRPDGTRQSGYHPRGFLTRHPSSAYAREASCGDCHNTAQFCQDCHRQSGLVATARLGRAGYHDAFRGFGLGHGQAARQSLETCAACHAERDCTACHSAVGGGFRFSPHGPGFNAARMRAKNPSVCVACHGSAIPG